MYRFDVRPAAGAEALQMSSQERSEGGLNTHWERAAFINGAVWVVEKLLSREEVSKVLQSAEDSWKIHIESEENFPSLHDYQASAIASAIQARFKEE